VGPDSQKEIQGDCSGIIWLAYAEAGFRFGYMVSNSYPNSSIFKKVPNQSNLQAGDVNVTGTGLYCTHHLET
jgi:hypothetical protein